MSCVLCPVCSVPCTVVLSSVLISLNDQKLILSCCLILSLLPDGPMVVAMTVELPIVGVELPPVVVELPPVIVELPPVVSELPAVVVSLALPAVV